VRERRGRGRKQVLDDLRETRWYQKLEKEALCRTLWRPRLERGYGPVVIAIPLQALKSAQGSRRSRLQNFQIIDT
jgi:hypothetical protein